MQQNPTYAYTPEPPLPITALTPYDSAYLTRIKTQYNLNAFVSITDFATIQAVARWVTGLWAHDGWRRPAQDDPLFILDEVTRRGQRFRCVEYGTVICGCLTALGIPARILYLKTSDAETRESGAGHVVAEAYLQDLRKWIFVDGQWGLIPMLDGAPLDGVELAQTLRDRADGLEMLPLSSQAEADKAAYFGWIAEYLYFFDFRYWQADASGGLAERAVMLTPVGVEGPRVFQRSHALHMDRYTHSVPVFYPDIGAGR